MARSIYIFLLVCYFNFLPTISQATVDYLSVNNITKEYYWGDDDHSTGWIGWEPMGEAYRNLTDAEIEQKGYTKTNNPFKIEMCLFFAFILIVSAALFMRKWK